MTLQYIKALAIANNACYSQLTKFIEFIESGDELQAWQTVLGNLHWLSSRGFHMKIDELERNAGGIGKRWHDNKQLGEEINYKNGIRHGLYRYWNRGGELVQTITYYNGRFV